MNIFLNYSLKTSAIMLTGFCIISFSSAEKPQSVVLSGADTIGAPRISEKSTPYRGKSMNYDKYEIIDLSNLAESESKKLHPSDQFEGAHPWLRIESQSTQHISKHNKQLHGNFISMTGYFSIGTEIKYRGAKIVVRRVRGTKDKAEITVSLNDNRVENSSFPNYTFPISKFQECEVILLPAMTIGVNAKTKTWSLYFGEHTCHASEMPLEGDLEAEEIISGEQPCFVFGIAVSNENPLFEDENWDGIPDSFESEFFSRNQSGDRSDMKEAWQTERFRIKSDIILDIQPPQL